MRQVLEVVSSIEGCGLNGFYRPSERVVDKENRQRLVWKSANGLKLEAGDIKLQHACVLRDRAVVAQNKTSHWDVWDGTEWVADLDFQIYSSPLLPKVAYEEGTTVLYLAFSQRPSHLRESIADALGILHHHVVVLREVASLHLVFIEIISGPDVDAKKCAHDLVCQCSSTSSDIWNTPLGAHQFSDGKRARLLEIVGMPRGLPPGPVTNVVAEVHPNSIEICWHPPRASGGHKILNYGVRVANHNSFVAKPVEPSCSIPRSVIEPLIHPWQLFTLESPLSVTAINAKGESQLALVRVTVLDPDLWGFVPAECVGDMAPVPKDADVITGATAPSDENTDCVAVLRDDHYVEARDDDDERGRQRSRTRVRGRVPERAPDRASSRGSDRTRVTKQDEVDIAGGLHRSGAKTFLREEPPGDDAQEVDVLDEDDAQELPCRPRPCKGNVLWNGETAIILDDALEPTQDDELVEARDDTSELFRPVPTHDFGMMQKSVRSDEPASMSAGETKKSHIEHGMHVLDATGQRCMVEMVYDNLVFVSYDDGTTISAPLSTVRTTSRGEDGTFRKSNVSEVTVGEKDSGAVQVGVSGENVDSDAVHVVVSDESFDSDAVCVAVSDENNQFLHEGQPSGSKTGQVQPNSASTQGAIQSTQISAESTDAQSADRMRQVGCRKSAGDVLPSDDRPIFPIGADANVSDFSIDVDQTNVSNFSIDAYQANDVNQAKSSNSDEQISTLDPHQAKSGTANAPPVGLDNFCPSTEGSMPLVDSSGPISKSAQGLFACLSSVGTVQPFSLQQRRWSVGTLPFTVNAFSSMAARASVFRVPQLRVSSSAPRLSVLQDTPRLFVQQLSVRETHRN